MVQGGEVSGNGRGLVVQSRAFLVAAGAAVRDNKEGGVLVSDAETLASLSGSTVAGNLRGIGVQLGATAEVQGCLVEGNSAEGVYVSRAGSRVLIVRSQVVRNAVKGVGVQHGGAAVLESSQLEANALVGVHVDGQGSAAVLRFNTMVSPWPLRANAGRRLHPLPLRWRARGAAEEGRAGQLGHPRTVVVEDGGSLRSVANRMEDAPAGVAGAAAPATSPPRLSLPPGARTRWEKAVWVAS